MFSINPKYYYDIFIHFCLFLVLFTLFHSYILSLWDKKNIAFIRVSGYTLLIFVLLFMGLRPYSKYFGDMVNYTVLFNKYAAGAPANTDKDVFFNYFTKFCSSVMTIKAYFALCTIIYIWPMYRISKELFKEYWYYSFLLFLVSFSFWTYGVNGMRNGMATSLFLLGVSYRRKKPLMIIIFIIASYTHQTVVLPILAYTISVFYNKPKVFIYGWFAAIPLSLILGGFWESTFASLGFGGDRLSYLTTEAKAGTFSRTGFRWDFLIYGAGAIFAGWYFIFKRKFNDKIYHQLFITYTICNAFWILVIRANFSNRFAYLSWFMMGLIIIYPFLKQQFFKNQHIVLGKVILLYFSFTYFMYLIS
ncbi:EpsG family protein [Tamlana sp. I1]|uniref:EpsG family protein n=1 Tax=Tamlana sp. I1 TaxID=2762061 RepID=UPI00188FB05E|nr:EpsG family protein [Tamlana sp. I1]